MVINVQKSEDHSGVMRVSAVEGVAGEANDGREKTRERTGHVGCQEQCLGHVEEDPEN
jgi:hypothetical protein